MGKGWTTLLLVSCACVALAPITSCVGPTEIDVTLSTNVDCTVVRQNGATVRIGSPENIATSPSSSIVTTACTGGDMGNIVVVPSGSPDAAISIEVVMGVGQSTDTCVGTSGSSCIYARRQLAFQPHAKLTLPIFLDSLCTGKTCPDTETCVAGQCVGSIIDPTDCDGGTCTPPTDAGGLPDAIVVDAPIDAIVPDAPCATTCGTTCVDLQTSSTNCGACGFDCSGGVCSAGTCLLNALVVGTSLGVYNGTVFVSTANGVAKVPTQGGAATFETTDLAYWIASMPSGLAWIEKKITNSGPDIYDLAKAKTYLQGAYVPEVLAMASSGYAFSESSYGLVIFQPMTGSPSTYFTFAKNAVIHVAMSNQLVYASDGTQIGWSAGQPTFANNVSAPTAIAVDDATTPNVYVVEKGTQIAKRSYNLALLSTYATGSVTIGSIVWDPTKQTIVANAGTEIDIASGGVLTPIATLTTKAVPQSVAVDATAAYWLGTSGGLYKHVK